MEHLWFAGMARPYNLWPVLAQISPVMGYGRWLNALMSSSVFEV